MSFTQTNDGEIVHSDCWETYGLWDGTGVTTGELDTQLKFVKNIQLTYTGNVVGTNAPSCNETLPGPGNGASAGILTILFDSGRTGCWRALGYK